MRIACTQEIPDSNLGWDNYPDYIFKNFLQSLDVIEEIAIFLSSFLVKHFQHNSEHDLKGNIASCTCQDSCIYY
jgi:hypothetical protein